MRSLGIVTTVALVAALSSCSDDGNAEPPEPSPSPSASETGSESTPATSPTDPATTSEPSVESSVRPAAGPMMELEHSSMRAPTSYEVLSYDDTGYRLAGDKKSAATISLNDLPAINPDLPLAERVQIRIRNNVYDIQPELAEPVTIAGERMYHVTGPVSEFDHVDEFGTVRGDHEIFITFTLPCDFAPAKREELIDSVLATLVLS